VLATAHLQQNRLDEAIGTATEALSFRKRLAPNRHEALVQEFEHTSRPVLEVAA